MVYKKNKCAAYYKNIIYLIMIIKIRKDTMDSNIHLHINYKII